MSLKFFLPKNPDAVSKIQSFQSTAPVDVLGIADAFGIAVWEDDLAPGISGKLFVDEENGGSAGYSMIVNEREPEVRKRFTIAHEISHFLLHRSEIGSELQDDTFYRSKLNSSMEREANRLAAEILIPASLLQAELIAGEKNISDIARRLQVSEAALKFHLGMPA